MLIYPDTSLLFPVYVPEERSAEADEIIRSASTVMISDLTVAEFYVSLARKRKLGVLSADEATVVREMFDGHMVDQELVRKAVGVIHYRRAGDVADASPVVVRTLDALHIAVALDLGAILATFDVRMADAARSLELEVLP